MRLEIICIDRVGIAQEILSILVKHDIDLKKVELDPDLKKIYLSFPEIEFQRLQEVMPELRKIPGITDVKTIAFTPSEREHYELNTLLRFLPDGVISIDSQGIVVLVNEAAANALTIEIEEILNKPIQHYLKGFNFIQWLESIDKIEKKIIKVRVQRTDYIADLIPLFITDTTVLQGEQSYFAGAVINLKSEHRLGEQITILQQKNLDAFNQVIANSTVSKRLLNQLEKSLNNPAPLLLIGEKGVGKKLLVKVSHDAGPYREKSFYDLNIEVTPESVIDTELFGIHEDNIMRSAKKGLLERLDTGGIYLEEITSLSMKLQMKLVNFLEKNYPLNTSFRFYFSTTKNLNQLVQDGVFREDLYHLIHILVLEIPPLRRRKPDILALAKYYLQKHCQQFARQIPKISESCQQLLQQYSWPGNVTQLNNTLYQALTYYDSDLLTKEQISLPTDERYPDAYVQRFDVTLEEATKEFEATLLRKLYPLYPSSRQLGKKLGLSHTAIANKLREYGINRDSIKI